MCLHVCVSSCVSACSGEVDCESSLVTHKASAIKAAHFNTLSYGKNTQMGEHSIQARATYTHMFSVTHFGFLFILLLSFLSLLLAYSLRDKHMCALFSQKCTHTHTYRTELRADSTICGIQSGSRRQDKRNQSVPAKYSMSPTSYSSWSSTPNNKSSKDLLLFNKTQTHISLNEKTDFHYFINYFITHQFISIMRVFRW